MGRKERHTPSPYCLHATLARKNDGDNHFKMLHDHRRWVCIFSITEHMYKPSPRVESDPLNWDTGRYSASQALTNSDKMNSNSNWIGKGNTAPTYFTYNLGCMLSVSKLVLRNGCNGQNKNL